MTVSFYQVGNLKQSIMPVKRTPLIDFIKNMNKNSDN
jgi:D-alanyl-D-alanine carboxypeptidase